jgi:hypothetical protein
MRPQTRTRIKIRTHQRVTIKGSFTGPAELSCAVLESLCHGAGERINMELITKTLMTRLMDKGVEIKIIPALMRDTINAIGNNNHEQNIKELNKQIQFLGWGDFELDEYTFQLIVANLETNALDTSGKMV